MTTEIVRFQANHVISEVTRILGINPPTTLETNSLNHVETLIAPASRGRARKVHAIALESVTFSHQLPNIREGSQKLQVTRAGETATFKFTTGSYSVSEFITSFNTKAAAAFTLDPPIMTQDPSASRITISNLANDCGVIVPLEVGVGMPTGDSPFSDRLLLNMLGYVESPPVASPHKATQVFNLQRDLGVTIHLDAANASWESLANNSAPQASGMTSAVFFLALDKGFGQLHAWHSTGQPTYVPVNSRENIRLFFTDARGARLPSDTTSQWVVSGFAVIDASTS